ncbi:MAG: glycosyltransferase [Christensenellales bacterium]
MRKILIYTVTAGSGHNTIANTIKNSLIENYGEDVEIKIVDLFKDYKTNFKAFVIDNGYRFSVKYFRPLYNFCFRKKQKSKPVKRNTLGVKFALSGKYKNILETIEEFQPNYIFCTHFLPAIALTNLKANGKLTIPFSTMVTDYVVCPYIEGTTGAENILTPCDDMKNVLLSIGFKETQILNYGFPAKIEKKLTTNENCEKRLNLLIMSGSGSFSGLDKNIKQLLKADLGIDINFVNGKNQKQKNKIQKLIEKYGHNNTIVQNFGFVDNDKQKELLESCDIIVTKCGANSLMEALNLGKVVITSDKLAEQELQNVEYFRKFIPIFLVGKKFTILNILQSEGIDVKYLNNYKQKIDKICKSGINKQYADFIYSHCKI